MNRLVFALSLLSLLGAEPASAHQEWSPIRVNRYCKVQLGDPPKIVYTILYGDGPALSARKAVDGNADGRLDAGEKAKLGTRAESAVALGLALILDGKRLPLRPTAVDVGLAGDDVAPEALSVDLTYELLLDEGPHTLTIDDRVEVPNEGDSEIAIEDRQTALVAAYRGAAASKPSRKEDKTFTFRGPRFSVLEDRAVTLKLRGGGAPAWQRAGQMAVQEAPLVGGVLAVLVAGFVVLRKRRYRNMNG